MENILNTLKRFLRNRNTVTIIGVIAIIGILYWGYNSQIERQVSPVRNIPVAKFTIQPGTLITSDMIDYIDVSPIVLNHGNVYRNANLIIGLYSDYNTAIPAGSMFYTDVLIEGDQLPDAAFVKIKDGEEPHRFSVNTTTTYGNSIFPGNKIDIYMKAVNEIGQVMVGKLIENVEVIAVKDSSGRNVFENTAENRSPAMLIFGLSPINHNLLLKASYLTSLSVELFPVPHGGTIEKPGDVRVSSQTLQDFINAYSVPNDELYIPDVEPEVEDLEENLGE